MKLKSAPNQFNQFTIIFLALAAGVIIAYALVTIIFQPKDLPLMPWAAVSLLFLIASLIFAIPFRSNRQEKTLLRRRPIQRTQAPSPAPNSSTINLLAATIAVTALVYVGASLLQKARSGRPQAKPQSRKEQP